MYVEQEVEERTFNDWTLEKVTFEEPVSVGDVMILRLFNNHIFVADRAYREVKRFTLNGELTAVYGNGAGQGPGEFQNLNAFWVQKNGEVWIVDQRANEISRFRPDGKFVESFHPDFPPHQIAALGEDQLVVHMLSQSKVFALLNKEGTVLKRFGTVIDRPQASYTFALDADMYPRPNGGFIWAPRFASYLFFYGADGTLERRIELIDGHPFPIDKMEPNPMRATARDLQRPHRTFGVSVTEEAIFVNILENRSDATVVDRYDRETGKYIDSFRLPSGGSRYHVHDGRVYGAADTTLRAYRIHR